MYNDLLFLYPTYVIYNGNTKVEYRIISLSESVIGKYLSSMSSWVKLYNYVCHIPFLSFGIIKGTITTNLQYIVKIILHEVRTG